MVHCYVIVIRGICNYFSLVSCPDLKNVDYFEYVTLEKHKTRSLFFVVAVSLTSRDTQLVTYK